MRDVVAGLTQRLIAQGYSSVDAMHRAWAMIYGAIVQQATTLAYVDVIWLLAVISLCVLPLVFFMRPSKGGPAMAH